MKIAIGADHAGFLLKEKIKKFLDDKAIDYSDFGTFKMDSCDYPEYAYKVAGAISHGEYDRGILVCGSGIGMAITANKIKGIRAATANDLKSAQLSRLHNDANVLCMGARLIENDEALKLLDKWLNESFEGGRHQKRIDLIAQLTGL